MTSPHTRQRPQDALPIPHPDDPRHGTVDGYNRIPCHHPCCRTALADYRRTWHRDRTLGRPRLVDATGTRRRLQALAAIGWSTNLLGPMLNMSAVRVRELQRLNPGDLVRGAQFDKVRRLYDRISMTIPDAHPASVNQARARALAAGWVPPLAWDEGTIDDPETRPRARRKTTA